MITRVKGTVREKRAAAISLDVGNLTYEVLIPPAVMSNLTQRAGDGIELVTYHYYQTDQSKSIPVLIGFLNEVEKEFFEKFITVSGVGPKAACKALALAFSAIADGIDTGDVSLLKRLPGIGERKAREIIAKLQGKVGKFGLIRDRDKPADGGPRDDIRQEALSVLLQLQYRKKEAEEMLDKAITHKPDVKNSEELLNEVYRTRNPQEK